MMEARLNERMRGQYGVPGPSVGLENTGRFRYTGQIWLPELGMYHYKARAYSPTLGRFMQPDPIGYADGLNMYRYVQNDPVNAIDPSGLTTCVAETDPYQEGSIVVCASRPSDNPFPSVPIPSPPGDIPSIVPIPIDFDLDDFADDLGSEIIVVGEKICRGLQIGQNALNNAADVTFVGALGALSVRAPRAAGVLGWISGGLGTLANFAQLGQDVTSGDVYREPGTVALRAGTNFTGGFLLNRLSRIPRYLDPDVAAVGAKGGEFLSESLLEAADSYQGFVDPNDQC